MGQCGPVLGCTSPVRIFSMRLVKKMAFVCDEYLLILPTLRHTYIYVIMVIRVISFHSIRFSLFRVVSSVSLIYWFIT